MSFRATHEDLLSAANTIRCLSMDGVQKANSGHPGMPMGMADVTAALFLNHMEHCPSSPEWMDRDRFVLSAGHGSMLIYSLLHLAGYDLSIADLQSFRQWKSRTPGHPERGETPGVETTAGPLGQGCGTAVGMALAERMLAERFNTPVFTPVDHYTYVLCSDGDLMEGISHEAFSLAGHLGLNKLIAIYDDNSITIEGSTALAYSDVVKKRFQGYNWNVIGIDAHNYDEIEKALRKARLSKDKPTIIICKSHIAHGSPNKHDTAGSHGAPLGADEIKATKRALGMPEDKDFHVPDRVREVFDKRAQSMKRLAAKWQREFEKYRQAHPDKAALWDKHFGKDLPADLSSVLPKFDPAKAVATRSASGKVIQALAKAIPNLVGGSADLAPSTKTLIDGAASIGPRVFGGRNLHFGIREHGMCAILNGMALHGGFRVFGSTFFVFADYCRPSIRLAALMGLPVIYVFTHDSFYVGEDGPTHQPVEHLASLRAMPNVTLIRPADPTETGAAWVAALKNTSGPTALMLTRQDLPVIDRSKYPAAENVEKGAYILWENRPNPDLIIIASGSEVGIALDAARQLGDRTGVRVVSMPSWELFEKQSAEYRKSVLPASCVKRLVVEAGSSFGWDRYAGAQGAAVCLDRFGASAPCEVLAEQFGFTAKNVVEKAKALLG